MSKRLKGIVLKAVILCLLSVCCFAYGNKFSIKSNNNNNKQIKISKLIKVIFIETKKCIYIGQQYTYNTCTYTHIYVPILYRERITFYVKQ